MKIVIVGAGEVGFYLASHLALENKEVVVIDKNADAIRRVPVPFPTSSNPVSVIRP